MPRYTNAQFLEAIDGCAGIISTVAARLDCSWETARDRIRKSPKLERAFQDEQEHVNDMAETTVLKSIKDGNTQDAKWWLARIRRDRFSIRTDIGGLGADGQIIIEVKMSDDDD